MKIQAGLKKRVDSTLTFGDLRSGELFVKIAHDDDPCLWLKTNVNGKAVDPEDGCQGGFDNWEKVRRIDGKIVRDC
jgi:hypothetical protein